MECNICKKEQEMDVKNVVKLILCDGCLDKFNDEDVSSTQDAPKLSKENEEKILDMIKQKVDESSKEELQDALDFLNDFSKDTESELCICGHLRKDHGEYVCLHDPCNCQDFLIQDKSVTEEKNGTTK